MCGILGIFNLVGQAVNQAHLSQMADTLRHRGPDDAGLWMDDYIGLGHQRLSILDLSQAGHQPMSEPEGNLWLVYNGEIYNYLELRAELEAKGYHFRSQTDTEVILAAYREYGVECLNKFNGMWAFALWDKQRQQLFCARDRFGVKPFYYALYQNQFIFASEPKALLKTFPELAIPNQQTIFQYLSTSITDNSSQTFYQSIEQLQPAHYLLIKPQESVLTPKRYWYLPSELQTLPDDPAQAYRELLADSIRLRLRSDVPIGTCLSGGLDSSSIVCLAKAIIEQDPHTQYQQHTFSSCFAEAQFDERRFIEQVLKHTQATPHYIFPTVEKLQSYLQSLIYTQDEPFGSLSIFAQYCVMEGVKEAGIKVLLDGQGADEALAGYGYDSLLWADLFRTRNFKGLGQEFQAAKGLNRLKWMLKMLFPWEIRSSNWEWLQAEFSHTYRELELPFQQPFRSYLKNQLYNLFHLRLPSLLRYEDRNSMAFSIESRLPFLDYRLVSLSFSLLENQLIHKGWSKWILREAMTGFLPETIQWRQDKMGFVTPQTLWFKNELAPLIREIIHDREFEQRPYWNAKLIQQDFQDFLKGRDDAISQRLWSVLNLELWLKGLKH